MATCDLCGAETRLVRAIVEGTELNVCPKCGQYGKILKKPIIKKREAPKPIEPEVAEKIVKDYPSKIGKARKQKNMTQEEFAKMLNEKESIIQKIEAGSFKPSIGLARKLEKKLNIKLIEEEKSISVNIKQNKSGPLTIGDLIKVKK